MKTRIFIFLWQLPFLVFAQPRVQNKGTSSASHNWTVRDVFSQPVFIENNEGQFDGQAGVGNGKVLYAARRAGVSIYFTSSGIIYRYDSLIHLTPEQREQEEHETKEQNKDDAPSQPLTYFFSALWKNSNPNVQVIVEDTVSFYYTYPKGAHTTIAHAFKKLLYKNLYPGIDIEYYFPENKPGLEYSIIVNPGADLSLVKLLCPDADSKNIDENGNMILHSKIGEFINYAPCKTFYRENQAEIKSSYEIKNKEISFKVPQYNHAETLIIDPWIVNPAFAGKDAAYDLAYDDNGNVYIMGGWSLNGYFLAKINSTGIIQWVNCVPTRGYGHFTVDKHTGMIYVGDAGFYGLSGPFVRKLNTFGIQIDSASIGMKMPEIWRMEYNQCTNNIVIAGGNPFTPSLSQASVIDDNLNVISSVNVLAVHYGFHDLTLLDIDNTGSYCYMGSACLNRDNYPTDNTQDTINRLLKCPLPTLFPNSYFVPDGYRFQEGGSNWYVAGGTVGNKGIADSPNWVYLYDGYTLKRFNKLTGSVISIKNINAPRYFLNNDSDRTVECWWAGIDVDNCDDLYLADKNKIDIIDSGFNQVGSIPMDSIQDTVYDLHLAPGNRLYACGYNFVSSFNIAASSPLTVSISKTPACSGCTGTATAMVSGCGNKNSTYSYSWSDGQTTQSATGLCPGSYTVNVLSHCEVILSDTITVDSSSKPGLNVTLKEMNEKCYGQTSGSAKVLVTGGSGDYSYLWSPSGNTTDSLTGLPIGTYNVSIYDTNGCADMAQVTITEPTPLFTTLSPIEDSCFGETIGSVSIAISGGVSPYSILWNPGNISGVKDSNLAAGTYTATVTDSNGCILQDTVAITQPPLLTLKDSIRNLECFDLNSGFAHVFVSGGTPAYEYIWQPPLAGQSSGFANNLFAGTYTCIVVDYHNCKDSLTMTLTQPPQLSVNISSPAEVPNGQQATLNAAATGGVSPYNYLWSNSVTGQSIEVMPNGNTVFFVTVTDSFGCKAEDTINLQIEPCPDIFIPTAFSPNGDGQNDVLYMRGGCISSMTFVIFDRWGNKVFESNNQNEGWDGAYNGKPMQTGTYSYYINGTYTDGKTFEKKGNITLVR